MIKIPTTNFNVKFEVYHNISHYYIIKSDYLKLAIDVVSNFEISLVSMKKHIFQHCILVAFRKLVNIYNGSLFIDR